MAPTHGTPSKRRRQLDPAQAAAALQEWNSKTWVWVPDAQEGFVAGYVVNEDEDRATVALSSTGELVTVSSLDLKPVNPPNYEGAEDIANLTHLNEASVVHNLKTRYHEDSIYTYSGLFLVAVNPYKRLSIYSAANVEAYKGRRRDENAPHVYAVAEQAWQSMLENPEQSQSILVTGESGAGKTENTKKIIQFLAAISVDPLPTSSSVDALAAHAGALARASGKQLGHLERQILDANPILEAFGNAQTVKNNNSSRFGKFVRIYFNAVGAIAGANIEWYLLEKSRVTARSESERSFHIFFQLLRGADRELRSQLLLTGNARDYEYLKHGRQDVDGMDDVREFKVLQAALNTVGFTVAEQLDLWRVIAAILHLGNVTVGGSRSDQAHLVEPAQLEVVCHLLGLRDPSVLHNALVRPKVKAGREWVTQARTAKQVTDEIAALSKSLYEKLFGAIVERINRALGRPATRTFIGVLDIAGFEIFETNGFEQLLINLTNEKLQQFFNYRMFVLEQEEYAREAIQWEFKNFGLELQPTIDLVESNNPMGVLSCLDDACIMPKSTDTTFTEKLNELAKAKAPAPHYSRFKASRKEREFTIKHYAGEVEYRTDGWLDKNRDPLSDPIAALLAHSTDSAVATMFSEYADVGADVVAVEGPRPRIRRGAFRTVGQRHKDQLSFLMTQLLETQPHFVRCIVPNEHKQPGRIDTPLVLHQLACNGVLEGIRIARLGFPNRVPFAEFRRRFELLAPRQPANVFVDGAEASRRILNALELDPHTYQLGLTKVFFKAGILATLEERRDEALSVIFTAVQAACRRFTGRRQAVKILHRADAVRTIQRNARLFIELRQWPWWPLFQRVRPLLAAARNDDEARRKEEELAAAKAQAQKEAIAREKLETIQRELEQDRAKMEAELASERSRGTSMENLLHNSKQREAALEEDLRLMQNDLDIVDGQLDRAMAAHQHAEDRVLALDEAVVNANALVATLQAELLGWAVKEQEWASQTSVKTGEWEQVLADREQGRQRAERLQADLADRTREHDRLKTSLEIAESRLQKETHNAGDVRKRLAGLESEVLAATHEIARLEQEKRDVLNRFAALESTNAKITRELDTLHADRDLSSTKASRLEVELATTTSRLATATRDLETARASQAKADRDLAALKALLEAKVSDHEQSARLNSINEAEVQRLKEAVTKAEGELAVVQRTSSDEATRLRQELDRAQRDRSTLAAKTKELTQEVAAAMEKLAVVTRRSDELEQAQQAHDLHLEVVRTQAAEETFKERNIWDRERAALSLEMQQREDRSIEADRARDEAVRDAEALRILLEAEQATVKQREQTIRARDHKLEQQLTVLADFDKQNGELRRDLHDTRGRLRLAEDKGGKVVIEHIRVLEEASRLQNLEIQRMMGEERARAAHVQTLQRQNTQLTQSIEDMQHAREAERREQWTNQPPKDNSAARALQDLESERRVRQLAEVNVNRLQSEIQQQQQQLDSLSRENAELRRTSLAFERELNSVAASDATSSTTYPSSTRRMGDSRSANGVPPSTNRMSATYGAKSSLPTPPPPPAGGTLPAGGPRRRNYE